MADTYPRSPKAMLGGIMHLGRMIDKVRLRHAGRIQDYNYLTAGFDKYLLDLLGLSGEAFERHVLAVGTDEAVLAWVRREGKALTEADIRLWNQGLLKAAPKDEPAQQRFHARLVEIAAKRGVPVESLPPVTTWVEAIELDEGRL
ncbi:MAG: DUF5069 domain-containing protein [Nitrospirota bacterium]|nr:DUF5069 domain-containing protein [Nitrospirota bacterium]